MKFVLFSLIVVLFFSCSGKEIVVKSPDDKIEVIVAINDSSKICYKVNFEGKPIVLPSAQGFEISEQIDLGKYVEIISVEEKEVNQSWKPVYGERDEIADNYREARILLRDKNNPGFESVFTVRVYNEGVAFNRTFLSTPEFSTYNIQKENTEFCFPGNLTCWASERAQSEIQKKLISEIKNPVERPLVLESGENFLALGEAALTDFSRMKFIKGDAENSLLSELSGEATVELPYTTPWRTILIGKSAGELLASNFLYENLNEPCAIEDVSWIKPGKVIREVTLTTQGGLACVDFAAGNGLQYVEFDAGWYGPENDDSSDATTVTVDPKRSPGPLDLQKVIDYAETKGIGIILYVNRRALEKQADVLLPLFQQWGVKGLKFGFVQVGPQEWTSWLHETVKLAAKYKLMVDIHDEYRPTGFSRTYPNLLTQEGIRGDEESPTNEHTLKTLFTRMLAGAADNTNCYYAPRVNEKMGGHVSQLAKAVMIYSPWQFLYWYDRPQGSPGKTGGAGSSDGFIQNHPELDFYKNLPTVWDDTQILEGKIGEFATLARKSGNDWFLGSLTANQPETVEIKTYFLNPEASYQAVIYSNDPESESSTKVKIETREVTSESVLNFEIGSNSGLAIHFRKN